MKKLFQKLLPSLLLSAIVFLLPANFFLKFFESEAYVNGLRVDYLIPKLFLSDIFAILLIGLWTIKSTFNFWKTKRGRELAPFFIILLLFIFRQFFSVHIVSSLTYTFRFLLMGTLLIFLSGKNHKAIQKDLIEKVMLVTILFQSLVGVFQYHYQKTLVGYLLLGEPNLSNFIGVTKTVIFGAEKILPYGTTAHPNVLGGFLAIYILYFFNKNTKPISKNIKISEVINSKNLIIALGLVTLFLTQSVSAILTLLLGLCLIFYRNNQKRRKLPKLNLNLKKVAFASFLLFFVSILLLNIFGLRYPNNQSFSRRNYLISAAVKMADANILTGVGLNNFTTQVEKFSLNREVVRFVQPVHNAFLLFLAETGLLGIFLFGAIVFYFHKSISENQMLWIIALLPIMLLDHYLLTLNAGLLMIVFSLGLFPKRS